MLGHIYEAKPKYDLLEKLLRYKIIDIKYRENINVIVDLKQVLRKIFRDNYNLESDDPGYLMLVTEDITSDIIGIISHYRNFFIKQCGKYTKFYFLYSESECEYYKNIYPDYKKDFYDKYVNDIDGEIKNDIINRVIKALKFVLNLIPNTFYIETSDYDERVYAKYILDRAKDNKEFSLILSNDELMYDLANEDSYCLNMKGIDTSCVTDKNIYSELGCSTKLSGKVFNLLLSIVGSDRYSLPGVKGYRYLKSIKIIEDLVKNENILDTKYLLFPIEENKLIDNKFQSVIKNNYDIIKRNFEIIEVDKLLSEKILDIRKKFVPNKKIVTYETFVELNQRVFRNYPLDINKLLRGELIK